jgi:hypothetical protein
MPQHAPFTDPLEVLVCGGATTEKVGLETCVSIQPEVPGAQWVVEQMVSGINVFFLMGFEPER